MARNVGNVWPDAKPSDFTAILLCAGEADFIRTFGSNRSLITINDVTLIEHQIRIIKRKTQISDIIVVLGFDADRTSRSIPKGIRIVMNERWQETTASHSLELALKATITPSAMILAGDLYFGIESISLPSKSTLTLAELKKEKVGVAHHGKSVKHLAYGLDDKWGQISYVLKDDISLLRRNLVGQDTACLFEVFNTLLDDGVEMDCTSRGGIVEINSYRDVETIG